ncbi:universal stress protein [Actinoplanes sp. NPDC020271]|uniref:universal stress protein n=1 Tax=Actinoplanes sp. NPDC020271 TaxID=3363896 RepID=UPI0037A3B700
MNVRIEELAAAIRDHLPGNTPWRVRLSAGHDAVELVGGASSTGDVVGAAVTDDAHAGEVLTQAWYRSCHRDAKLRAVHVWTGRRAESTGVHSRPDRPHAADLLLSEALYDALPPDEADATEREILHDRDPAKALRALSHDLGLLVVAAASGPVTQARPFGATVAALIGHTACPLAVVLPSRSHRGS